MKFLVVFAVTFFLNRTTVQACFRFLISYFCDVSRYFLDAFLAKASYLIASFSHVFAVELSLSEYFIYSALYLITRSVLFTLLLFFVFLLASIYSF